MAAARRSSRKGRSLPRAAAEPAPHSPWRRSRWLCVAAIVLAGALTYANSVDGPYILDDQVSIVDNSDIRQVWSTAALRSTAGESPVVGRPLVTLSFAINYAIGGLSVRGYHVVNIGIHILCALVSFGIVLRLHHSIPFAFACASLWMLHPLNSEAVDYLSQRTELMMGLFYLLTLYASVRAHRSTHSTRWLVAAAVSSALGMACKQSMVTVPVAAILVDRVFFFGSFAETFRFRWRFYTALAVSWLVLVIATVISPTVHSMGFASGVRPWTYLLNQSVMITQYLRLAIWPRALVADYGYPRALVFGDVVPQMLLIASLAGLTLVAFRWRPKIALLAALFFITLSPSSSLVPVATEVGAERRMYLPLAALVVLAVSLAAWLLDRISESGHARAARTVAIAGVAFWAMVAVSFAGCTIVRNQEYASALTLARTAVDRWPSGHARHVLGVELLKAGNRHEAIVALREAIREDSRAHYTLGVALFDDGRPQEAREQLQEFLRLEPLLEQAVDARALIARSLFAEGRLDAAAEQFGLALAMRPSFPEGRLGLAETRFAQHRYAEAIPEYRAHLSQRAENDGAWINLGVALQRTGQSDSAIQAFRKAAELNPQSSLPYRNLAGLLLEKGDVDGAAGQARQAVALSPADPLAHDLLGVALFSQHRLDEAIAQFQESARLDPSDAEALGHLRQALRMRASGGR